MNGIDFVMKDGKEHKNYMSKQEFISEFAKRTQMNEEQANQVVTAILEILDKNRRNHEPTYFDTVFIQSARNFSYEYSFLQ